MSEASISVKLGELLELVIDHRGKTPKKMGFEDFHQSGFPVLSAKHVKNGELVNTESIRFANEDMYRKWMKVEVEEGDIILTSEAPLGKVFYLDGSKKYVLGQRVFGLRPRKNLVDPVYLTVWLTSTNGQAALIERATGSTVLGIKQSELLKIEVDLPDSKIQSGMAKVYRSLDDKIALNRKLNATLEAMAQALFQSWFVDFDPVKAKLAAVRCGRDPEQAAMAAIACKLVVPPGKPKADNLDEKLPSAEAIDAAIAALAELSEAQRQSLKEKAAHFPADFQESVLGLIPQGWEVKALGELCSQSIGGQWGSEEDHPDLVPAICLRGCDMADITKGGYAPSAPIRFIKLNALEKRRITESDLLIASSGAGPCGRPLWCSSNLSQERYGFPVIYSNFVKRFTFGEPSEAIFAEMVLLPMYLNYSIGDYITGTSVPNLDSKGLLSGLNLCLPSKSLLRLFEKSYRYFEMCRSLDESRTLANLRDTLLPKLLSGEISVSPN